MSSTKEIEHRERSVDARLDALERRVAALLDVLEAECALCAMRHTSPYDDTDLEQMMLHAALRIARGKVMTDWQIRYDAQGEAVEVVSEFDRFSLVEPSNAAYLTARSVVQVIRQARADCACEFRAWVEEERRIERGSANGAWEESLDRLAARFSGKGK